MKIFLSKFRQSPYPNKALYALFLASFATQAFSNDIKKEINAPKTIEQSQFKKMTQQEKMAAYKNRPSFLILPQSAPVQKVRKGNIQSKQTQLKRIQETRQLATNLSKSFTAKDLTNSKPGIHQVNNKRTGVFEPGAMYLIQGNGFGDEGGNVVLRKPNQAHLADLKVVRWHNSYVFVEVPDNISGIPDYDKVHLTVAPAKAAPFHSNAFGFYAAREAVKLASVPEQAIAPYKRNLEFIPIIKHNLGGKNGTFSVSRWQIDDNRWGCFDKERDRFYVKDVPLKPGFEITDLQWTHDRLVNNEDKHFVRTSVGPYSLEWLDSNTAQLTSGVQRVYRKNGVFAGSSQPMPGTADCSSFYTATVIAVGPRGMPAQ